MSTGRYGSGHDSTGQQEDHPPMICAAATSSTAPPSSSAPPAAPTTATTACRVYYATQSGRAKACARRASRMIRQGQKNLHVTINVAMDDDPDLFTFGARPTAASSPSTSNEKVLHLLFVSTTGDGEQPDNMRQVWRKLLHKSLPSNHFDNVVFALFCLGDRAYGDLFCAAGRKLAIRLLQLGATLHCPVGYGDDNTPNGGVFADLDAWLQDDLLPSLPNASFNDPLESPSGLVDEDLSRHYMVTVIDKVDSNGGLSYPPQEEWRKPEFSESYRKYMDFVQPRTAYKYKRSRNVLWGYERMSGDGDETTTNVDQGNSTTTPAASLLEFRVAQNDRLTPHDWSQNTRHVRLELVDSDEDNGNQSTMSDHIDSGSAESLRTRLPYQAGDVAVILPVNSEESVERFLNVLPDRIRSIADVPMTIALRTNDNIESGVASSSSCTPWPERCTLRGWLTLCADIQALPEREDLRSLALYCDTSSHPFGRDQQAKLVGLSETSESASYVDYILREKRCWADVLHDFDSLRSPDSPLTVEALLTLLSPIRPREFSIASSPTLEANRMASASKMPAVAIRPRFGLELCVAKVEGRTPLGRTYHGLCSTYLSTLAIGSTVRLWIRPGTFLGLPLELDGNTKNYDTPVLCIGAGTGIAPLRGLIHEREAVRDPTWRPNDSRAATTDSSSELKVESGDKVLVFGCRKESCDFYYSREWTQLCKQGRLNLVTAFSQDQWHKVYVQQVLRKENENSQLLRRHLIERDGAIYIAGNPKMARAVKDEIRETLARELGGDDKQARLFLTRLQRAGRYSVEAWS